MVPAGVGHEDAEPALGRAVVIIVSAVAEYDPGRKGFVLTFSIDEGDRYNFGAIDIQSGVRDVDTAVLRSKLRFSSGAIPLKSRRHGISTAVQAAILRDRSVVTWTGAENHQFVVRTEDIVSGRAGASTRC